MTRIAAVENARYSAFRSFRCGRSSFLRCTFSAFAGLFICALPLAHPSGAQPLAGSGLAADVTPPARANPLDRITPVTDAMLVRVPDGDWLTWRYRLFAPQSDHAGQRAPSAIGVGVVAAAVNVGAADCAEAANGAEGKARDGANEG
jgi:hypothetical protein